MATGVVFELQGAAGPVGDLGDLPGLIVLVLALLAVGLLFAAELSLQGVACCAQVLGLGSRLPLQ